MLEYVLGLVEFHLSAGDRKSNGHILNWVFRVAESRVRTYCHGTWRHDDEWSKTGQDSPMDAAAVVLHCIEEGEYRHGVKVCGGLLWCWGCCQHGGIVAQREGMPRCEMESAAHTLST